MHYKFERKVLYAVINKTYFYSNSQAVFPLYQIAYSDQLMYILQLQLMESY